RFRKLQLNIIGVQREELSRDPGVSELFLRTHQNKNNLFVDAVAKATWLCFILTQPWGLDAQGIKPAVLCLAVKSSLLLTKS
nr:hypothetical protein [Tanacetum cinerariifolium]